MSTPRIQTRADGSVTLNGQSTSAFASNALAAATVVGGSFAPSAVTAAFSASFAGGQLTVFGDNLFNTIELSRDAAGKLLVNDGAVKILGGTPTVANTDLITVFGQGGNDKITLDQSNGALPRANLFGGEGHDLLVGGSGADMLFGQSGNDQLEGKGGNDLLFGGEGNDVLIGGDAKDSMFGESGDDRMIWNPGDDDDLAEGGAGNDTLEVNGGGSETFKIIANGTRVRVERIDPAPFAIDLGTTENIEMNLGNGDDVFSTAGNLAALAAITVDGGAGNDTITGSNGNDQLFGGDGNDVIDGAQGNDRAFLGNGDDRFVHRPGGGSDSINGGSGNDTLDFGGTFADELFELAAVGDKAQVMRNIGAIVTELDKVERVELAALGGEDRVVVRSLAGTDVKQLAIDLAASASGTEGDGVADTVVIEGGAGAETVVLAGVASGLQVSGLAAQVVVGGADGSDTLHIASGGGDDRIDAGAARSALMLMLDGGAGNDSLRGSLGEDRLLGGDGNDIVEGRRGNDTARLGAGDDRFVAIPGDGNDTVDGEAGVDVYDFNGDASNETVVISQASGQVRFAHGGSPASQLSGIEVLELAMSGGDDSVNVGDLAGSGVQQVQIGLGILGEPTDRRSDSISVSGSQAAETIRVLADGAATRIDGIAAQTRITGFDATLDRLTVFGAGGDDLIDASAHGSNRVALELQGGLGNDRFVGSEGNDLILGDDGADTAAMGGGDDVFVWNPGDDNDRIDGQQGADAMRFNGANIAETIDISARTDGHARFFRNVAVVEMDLDNTEVIDFRALGGADLITVNDLGTTDVHTVRIDLSGPTGGGDGQIDEVALMGTAGDDRVFAFVDGGVLKVLGLGAEVEIRGFEAGRDILRINGLAGDDVIEASSMTAAAMKLQVFGGDGDDVLIGGAGDELIDGGNGDDVLFGGPGLDTLVGGPGDDLLFEGEINIQDVALTGVAAPGDAGASLLGF